MRWLRRLALRAVPRSWRATVEHDLLEEASRRPDYRLRTDAWVSLQAVRIGVALRTHALQRDDAFMSGRSRGPRFGWDRLRVDLRETRCPVARSTMERSLPTIGLPRGRHSLADPSSPGRCRTDRAL
jgi:hypothetical protein